MRQKKANWTNDCREVDNFILDKKMEVVKS